MHELHAEILEVSRNNMLDVCICVCVQTLPYPTHTFLICVNKYVRGLTLLSRKNTKLLILKICCCCCQVASVVSDSVQPHRRQPTRLPRPWDSPGKNTEVSCHFLLQCIKVKTESEVAQSCPTLSDPIDGSPPGSTTPGILQARTLEWVAISFSSA